MYERDIEFLFEVGTLHNMARGWTQHITLKCASVLDHSARVALLALMLARREGVKDEGKIVKMALIHDLAEARVSDLSYMQKVYVKADEEKAAEDLFKGTVLDDLYADVLKEFEERETIEAKIVKDADNLDIDLELAELKEQGSRLPDKWIESRKMVRNEKLYTDSAKKLWDEIQGADPSSWHLTSNKWFKIPDAGK